MTPLSNVTVSPEDLKSLQQLTRCGSTEQRLAQRARLVLDWLAGATLTAVAERFRTERNTVSKWVHRFVEQGLDGLRDQPRSGAPAKYGPDLRQRILAQLEQAPPAGYGRWDGRLLAEALDVHPQAVWKVLKREGIQLARKRSWCISRDPDFAEKAADVVALYLNPPLNAVVFSVDEKPSIQALQRQRGYAPAGKRVVRGEGSTYRRNGVTNLFAALNVGTGQVMSKTTATKKRTDFLAFMDEVVAAQPVGQEIHVVLDNLSTHKRCTEWLTAHPNVTFHFTPTSASWLNQVEIWFNILTRKALDGASFTSLDQLVEALTAYTAAYNKTAQPFRWKVPEVRGAQLRNTLRNLEN